MELNQLLLNLRSRKSKKSKPIIVTKADLINQIADKTGIDKADVFNQKLAEKLRLAVEKASFKKINQITISLGISTFREDDTFADLFKRVDQGLYYAKEHGRNIKQKPVGCETLQVSKFSSHWEHNY